MKRIFRHIRRARAAFTLMEVNLAIFIMAVGVLAMTALYPLGFRESEQSRDDVRAAIVADEVLGKLSAALSSRNITWAKWKDAVQDAVDKTNNGGAGNAWFSYFKRANNDTYLVRDRGSVNGHAREVFSALAKAADGATKVPTWENYDNKFSALYSAAENLASLMVYIFGAYLILIQKRFDYAILITFAGYVGQLTGPMDFMSFFFRWFTSCMNSAQRMFEIIDAVPEIAEKENAVSLDTIDGTIEMKDVTFGYEKNKPVLKNINMKVEGGHMLGIVGRSGAGKTTIVNLISRLYDPQEGTVTLDGVNLKDLSFKTLRGNVAMVSQETYMFMGTVAENIAYAKKDASRAEIIRAAVLASAHDFICRMPDGYDTIIGSSGRELSPTRRYSSSTRRRRRWTPRPSRRSSSPSTCSSRAVRQSPSRTVSRRFVTRTR